MPSGVRWGQLVPSSPDQASADMDTRDLSLRGWPLSYESMPRSRPDKDVVVSSPLFGSGPGRPFQAQGPLLGQTVPAAGVRRTSRIAASPALEGDGELSRGLLHGFEVPAGIEAPRAGRAAEHDAAVVEVDPSSDPRSLEQRCSDAGIGQQLLGQIAGLGILAVLAAATVLVHPAAEVDADLGVEGIGACRGRLPEQLPP